MLKIFENAAMTLLVGVDYWEAPWTDKGYYPAARLEHGEMAYQLSFYDPVRLLQDCREELRRYPAFLESNLIVVPAVTLDKMREAVVWLVESGELDKLRPTDPRSDPSAQEKEIPLKACDICDQGSWADRRAYALETIACRGGPEFLKKCTVCDSLWLETLRFDVWVSRQQAEADFGGPLAV